jgi:glucosylceramidase
MKFGKVQLLLFMFPVLLLGCSKSSITDPVIIEPEPDKKPLGKEVALWVTQGDQTALLSKRLLNFGGVASSTSKIEIDSTTRYQSVDGFGYTLTGGSAMLISKLGESQKNALLQELFGKTANDISINYLRISVGASDLDEKVFSYHDVSLPDTTLTGFNLAYDTLYLLPILKKVLAINPAIKLMATPWSPPKWMKDNTSSIGGSLLPIYYKTYANYLVKYLAEMKKNGIEIDAMTIQNEPQHGGNNPSMVMSSTQQADFVKNHLGPAFEKAGIKTKIVVWDHNCDKPDFPISILNDAAAKKYIDGSAFHLYAGDISALSAVKSAHQDKNLYFTEQWTGAKGAFDGDLLWHIKNVVIGSMRNWSKTALEWNLANDINFGPHTPGGCTECKGALTINGSTVTKNVGYYIVAHASKFVPTGSVRIASSLNNSLPNVAFQTPDNKKVMIVMNEGNTSQIFDLVFNGNSVRVDLPAKSVGTIVF